MSPSDVDLFGTLSILELLMLLTNLAGLILAVMAAGEAHMDFESVRILGRRGEIAGADVRQRILKAKGSRRDETLKVLLHGVLLGIGVIIAASPAPRMEYAVFAAFWTVLGIIMVGVTLSIGSVYTLRDRRTLWAMFDAEDEQASEQNEATDDADANLSRLARPADRAETDTWATSGGQP